MRRPALSSSPLKETTTPFGVVEVPTLVRLHHYNETSGSFQGSVGGPRSSAKSNDHASGVVGCRHRTVHRSIARLKALRKRAASGPSPLPTLRLVGGGWRRRDSNPQHKVWRTCVVT